MGAFHTQPPRGNRSRSRSRQTTHPQPRTHRSSQPHHRTCAHLERRRLRNHHRPHRRHDPPRHPASAHRIHLPPHRRHRRPPRQSRWRTSPQVPCLGRNPKIYRSHAAPRKLCWRTHVRQRRAGSIHPRSSRFRCRKTWPENPSGKARQGHQTKGGFSRSLCGSPQAPDVPRDRPHRLSPTLSPSPRARTSRSLARGKCGIASG